MTKRRIMLVEAVPKKALPIQYATLDQGVIGPDLSLSEGDLHVQMTAAHPDEWRVAQCTLAPESGQWYWETEHFFSGNADLAAGGGIGGSLFLELGSSAPQVPTNIGGPKKSGECMGGIPGPGDSTLPWAVYSPMPAPTYIVRHWLDAGAQIYRTAVNNGPWVEATIDTPNVDPATLRTPFRPQVALQRNDALSSAWIRCNFGASSFAYPVPPGVNPGVYTEPEPVDHPLFFSSHPFGTAAGDDPPSQPYDARIAGDVEVSREGRCWVWGGQTQASAGSIELINIDGGLDSLVHLHWRDAEIRIYAGHEGDPRSAFTLWHRGIADRIEFDSSSQRARIVLTDALAVYDTPIQPETYPDDHPIPAVIGRPIPITFGIPFGVTGVLQSPLTVGADAFAWQHHDGIAPALSGLGWIYDGGIEITAHCERWPAAPPYKGFRVIGPKPVGRVTIDAVGNASTTLQIIVDNALARLDPDRGPALVVEQQPGGVDGIGAWAGIYIDEPLSILDVVRQAMDSVTGWACPTRDGTRLRLGRVRDPQGHTPVLTLTPDNVIGGLQITLDTAPHLTTRLAGRRNYSPHSHSEIAASISDPASPDYNANRVADLMAEWRTIREGNPQAQGGSVLSDAYAQARTADHRGTLLQQAHHIQAEANRVCTLWYPTRHFVQLTALLDAVPADELEPGDIVRLQWPRFGLDVGALLMVVAVRSRFFSRRVDLTLWGSLPKEQ